MKKRILQIIVFCPSLFFLLLGCFYENSNDQKLKETIKHLSNSIEYDNKATAIINKGNAYSFIKSEDAAKMIEFYKKAFEEVGIPGEAGHRFRSKPATDSDRFRPPIPTQSGHPVLTHSRS